MKNFILLTILFLGSLLLEAQTEPPINVLLKKVNKRKSFQFFNPQVSKHHVDYRIKNLSIVNDSICEFVLEKRGLDSCNLKLELFSGLNMDTSIFIQGDFKTKSFKFPAANFEKAKVITENTDIFLQNNTIKSSGLFKKLEPIKFQFIISEKNPDYTQAYFSPLVGWNYQDELLAGCAFYNNPLAVSRLNYLIMPFYSSNQNNIAGNVKLDYMFFPNLSFVENVKFGLNAKKYAYENYEFISEFHNLNENFVNTYTKLAPEICIEFIPLYLNSEIRHNLRFRNVHINKDVAEFHVNNNSYSVTQEEKSYYMNTLEYFLENTRKVNSYSLLTEIEQNNQIVKASLTYNYKVNYNKYNKSFNSRFFFGGFLFKKELEDIRQDYRFRLSSWGGLHDYLYDYYFMGRSSSVKIINQQAVLRDGGFKVPTGLGQTWDWLGAMNLDIPFPGSIPIGMYSDLGVFVNKEGNVFNDPTILYDIGVKVDLFKEIVSVYFPAIVSEEIKENLDLSTENYAERIRFTLYLNKLNPFR